jgi:hypothetical protein
MPAFRDKSSAASGAPTTALTLSVPPAVINGDLMIAFIAWNRSEFQDVNVNAPNGWTVYASVQSIDQFNNGIKQVAYARGAFNEPGSYTWNFSASCDNAGIIVAYYGQDPNNAIGDARSQASSVQHNQDIIAPQVTFPPNQPGMEVNSFGIYLSGATPFTSDSFETKEVEISATGNCSTSAFDANAAGTMPVMLAKATTPPVGPWPALGQSLAVLSPGNIEGSIFPFSWLYRKKRRWERKRWKKKWPYWVHLLATGDLPPAGKPLPKPLFRAKNYRRRPTPPPWRRKRQWILRFFPSILPPPSFPMPLLKKYRRRPNNTRRAVDKRPKVPQILVPSGPLRAMVATGLIQEQISATALTSEQQTGTALVQENLSVSSIQVLQALQKLSITGRPI